MDGFKVTDTRQVSSMTQAGGEQKFYRVWLQTNKGATGYVDVEPDDWDKEKLSVILEAKAAELDLAFGL